MVLKLEIYKLLHFYFNLIAGTIDFIVFKNFSDRFNFGNNIFKGLKEIVSCKIQNFCIKKKKNIHSFEQFKWITTFFFTN